MKVVFRCDASLTIGSGHVMRCLTLADELRHHDAEVHFICREHPGNLITMIKGKGYRVWTLLHHPETTDPEKVYSQTAHPTDKAISDLPLLTHAAWLGSDWQTDADLSSAILSKFKPDWVVVDHYALDTRWEQAVSPHCTQLMVIDDLTDRSHHCRLLLNQNLGRQAQEYRDLTPATTTVLTGANYSLLRPEFAQWRPYSLERRKASELKKIMIAMGGVDNANITTQALHALKETNLLEGSLITVVMGQHAPWLKSVQEEARQMPWPTQVLVNISDMAKETANADFVIGAAGSTSWERCCLGVPSILVVLAENQIPIANALEQEVVAYAVYPENSEGIKSQITHLMQKVIASPDMLNHMSQTAANVTDGLGCNLVIQEMLRATHD